MTAPLDPILIPMLLDRLVRHEPATLPLHVTGSSAADAFVLPFGPSTVVEPPARRPLRRPRFLARLWQRCGDR